MRENDVYEDQLKNLSSINVFLEIFLFIMKSLKSLINRVIIIAMKTPMKMFWVAMKNMLMKLMTLISCRNSWPDIRTFVNSCQKSLKKTGNLPICSKFSGQLKSLLMNPLSLILN